MRLKVFVPVASKLCERIWTGSGVVGSLVGETGRLRVDFEGDDNRFPTIEARVERAAERHLWRGPDGQRYPTSAMAYVDPDGVFEVGRWKVEAEEPGLTDPEEMMAWLEEGHSE